jgi:hypothetical protein
VEIKSLLDLCQQEIIACPNRCPYIFAGAYQEYDFYAQYELLYWLDILNWLPELPSIPRNCLDIGCNYGTLLLIMKHLYPEISLYGIDLSALVPQELVGKYSINFYLGDIELESIPWQDKFDVIIFTAVLEHLEFPRTARYEHFDNIPHPSAESKRPQEIPGDNRHVYEYYPAELFDLLERAGFSISRRVDNSSRLFNLELFKNDANSSPSTQP